MKILFLRSNPVSPDSRVEKEVQVLKELNKEVSVFCWDRTKDSFVIKSVLENGVSIYRIGIKAGYSQGFKKNLKPLIKFQISIIKFLFKNRKKIEIIHACDFDTAFSAFIFSIIFKKKLVYDIFDYYVDAFNVPNYLKKLIAFLDRKIIKFANITIICTEKRKEQIKEANPKKLIIIHNTPPKIEDISRKKLENKKIKIVYVGILPENGRMIKELVEIVEENETLYELHIAGFGPLENYLKEKSKINENIKFYGKISYMKTLELENSCDIMTAIYDPSVPNHFYAAPNKFYESLMLGKPLIMIKNTGMSEIVSQYKIGEVIDYNKSSLEKGLKNLVNRKNEWQEIKKIENELYEKKYSWEIMSKRIKKLYDELYI